jgi:hypothetical protein
MGETAKCGLCDNDLDGDFSTLSTKSSIETVQFLKGSSVKEETVLTQYSLLES